MSDNKPNSEKFLTPSEIITVSTASVSSGEMLAEDQPLNSIAQSFVIDVYPTQSN